MASPVRLGTPVLAALACLHPASAVEADEAPGARADADAPGGVAGSAAAPSWRWRQVLATPRVGGRLTTVAVDPEDARRLYVGTEESTLLRTDDGGVTWLEVDMTPVVVEDRAFTLAVPGLPALGSTAPSPMRVFIDPPEARFSNRVLVTGVDLVQYATLPEAVTVAFVPVSIDLTQDLLANVVASHREETEPVRRILVCPGATYPLLVAARDDLYGSMDHGLTFVRLFGQPGVTVRNIACSPADPNDVVLATGFGLYRSRTGGLSWDQVLVGWPGAPATAVAFGPAVRDARPTLYAAWGSELFAGDPDSPEGLRQKYPDFQNSATAPWTDLWWIAAAPDGSVWAGAEDGLRVSHDGGENWSALERSLFERDAVFQIVHGESEAGGARVAVVQRQWVHVTDDGGQTWHPFFHGLTRRGFDQLAVGPRVGGGETAWWLVTSGELWTTAPPAHASAPPSPGARADRVAAWARRRLVRTPPLGQTVDDVLEAWALSGREYGRLVERARSRTWIPRVDLQLLGVAAPGRGAREEGPSDPRRYLESVTESRWEVFAQAIWSLRELPLVHEELSAPSELHELRNLLLYAVEDAWHERMALLRDLSSGGLAAEQRQIKLARIEGLEALLDTWLGRAEFGEAGREGGGS